VVCVALGSVFRYTEIDCLINVLTRMSAHGVMHGVGHYREDLLNMCVDMLLSYRLHCATSTTAGQLILPESLKLLPLYVMALFKHAAFRGKSEVRADERVYFLMRFERLPVSMSSLSLYPALRCLHRSLTNDRKLEAAIKASSLLPPTIASTGEKVSSDGVYLMDDDEHFLIYVGCDVRPSYVTHFLGLEVEEPVYWSVGVDGEASPLYSNGMAAAGGKDCIERRIVQHLRALKGSHPHVPVRIIPARSGEEGRFSCRLVEDPVSGEASYVDFLCQIHRLVNAKLD